MFNSFHLMVYSCQIRFYSKSTLTVCQTPSTYASKMKKLMTYLLDEGLFYLFIFTFTYNHETFYLFRNIVTFYLHDYDIVVTVISFCLFTGSDRRALHVRILQQLTSQTTETCIVQVRLTKAQWPSFYPSAQHHRCIPVPLWHILDYKVQTKAKMTYSRNPMKRRNLHHSVNLHQRSHILQVCTQVRAKFG